MKGFLLGLVLLCSGGCITPSSNTTTLPDGLKPLEPKLERERFEQISFEFPDNWGIERVPSADANLSIVGGLSADNKSLFLLVSLKNADPSILREPDLVQLAKEKFFNNAEPIKLVSQAKINNLTGTQAEFVSTLGNSVAGAFSNNAHRALLFVAYHRGTAFLFVVATEERSLARETEKLLQVMMESLRGEG